MKVNWICAVSTRIVRVIGNRRTARFGRDQSRNPAWFSRFCHAGGLQAIPQQLLPAREQLLVGNLAGIDIGQDRSLGCVVFVYDARLALQHPPRLTTLDAEQNELPRDRPVLDVSFRALDFDVDAEVGNVGAVFGKQVAAIHHILLSNADEHVFQRDQLVRLVLLDLLEVVAESGLGKAPVGDGIARNLFRALRL